MIFLRPDIAKNYDEYYITDFGKKVDSIEQKIISSLINDIPRTEMLELGCGTGHWSEFFAKQGFSVLGVDISEAMLKIARSKNINAEFKIVDSENLPFKDESYQVISSITMLEFVEDQDKVIQEVYRVLKKDGWFILGCLNANSILAKNKEADETFKNANFLTIEDIKTKLEKFKTLQVKFGVYMNSDYTLLDGSENLDQIDPVFMGVAVQKH